MENKKVVVEFENSGLIITIGKIKYIGKIKRIYKHPMKNSKVFVEQFSDTVYRIEGEILNK